MKPRHPLTIPAILLFIVGIAWSLAKRPEAEIRVTDVESAEMR